MTYAHFGLRQNCLCLSRNFSCDHGALSLVCSDNIRQEKSQFPDCFYIIADLFVSLADREYVARNTVPERHCGHRVIGPESAVVACSQLYR